MRSYTELNVETAVERETGIEEIFGNIERARMYPFVSIIVPAWNEEAFIAKTLDSLLAQDYPRNRSEIIVIDDFSTDNTLKIAIRYSEENPTKVKVLSNGSSHEFKNSALARRLGMRNAKGEIFINFSAHVLAPKNFVSTLVGKLMSFGDDVVAVGCRDVPDSNSPLVPRSIYTAMTSFFGGAGTSTIYPSKDCFVDQVAFAAFRKSIIQKIGGYPLGDDSELNIIIKRLGYKEYFTNDTFVYYRWRPRSIAGPNPFIALFKRMIDYGTTRMWHIKKYPSSLKIVYCIPSFLVLTFVITIQSYMFHPNSLFTILGFAVLCIYLLLAITSSIYICLASKSLKMIPITLLSYLTMHFGYGVGFLSGLIKKNNYDKVRVKFSEKNK